MDHCMVGGRLDYEVEWEIPVQWRLVKDELIELTIPSEENLSVDSSVYWGGTDPGVRRPYVLVNTGDRGVDSVLGRKVPQIMRPFEPVNVEGRGVDYTMGWTSLGLRGDWVPWCERHRSICVTECKVP